MNALSLLRAGHDTAEIATIMGFSHESQAYNALSACRKEEHARNTGSAFVIPAYPHRLKKLPYAGKEA